MTESADYQVRDFPMPFSAMLSIVNDIDATHLSTFQGLHEFLNTYSETRYGVGLGLDIADSFWMYGSQTDPLVMSYYPSGVEGSPGNADEILEYIKRGWIDSIHTWGDFEQEIGGARGRFSRSLAQRALEELSARGVVIAVWINHGGPSNRQNFPGSYRRVSYMRGDVIGEPEYNSDLAMKLGVKFFQAHDVSEFGEKRPIHPYVLSDGNLLWGFTRNSTRAQPLFWRAIGLLIELASSKILKRVPSRYPGKAFVWHPQHLHTQLSERNLRSLVSLRNVVLVAQHLGYKNTPLPNRAVAALRRLKEYSSRGDILVSKSSWLLNYLVTRDYLKYSVVTVGNEVQINVDKVEDPVSGNWLPDCSDLRGICFVGPGASNAKVLIRGNQVEESNLERFPESSAVQFRWH